MHHESAKPVDMLPGVVRRTMTDGARMMLCEVTMERGALVPTHTHEHEQTGYLVSGRIRLTIGDTASEMSPGDSWMVPGNAPHAAEAIESSVLIDVFSPPREDYRA